MQVKNYSLLADIYPHLMRKIDYNSWAEYIEDIIEYCDLHPKSVLEIAAGHCSVADLLSDKYDLFIASDLSIDMLKRSENKNLLKTLCDMRALPFNEKFDFIYSTFDSVNYLLTEEDLLRFFKEINKNLSDDGVFTFDASLEKNSIKYEKELNRIGKYNGVKYRQISHYDRRTKIHTNEFIITDGNGKERREIHKQRIYDLVDFFEIIENSGMFVIDCFEAFSFENADMNTDRAQFIIEKA